MAQALRRTIYKVVPGRMEERIALERQAREMTMRLGMPPSRIYRPMFGALPDSFVIVERDLENLAAYEPQNALWETNAELAALAAQVSALNVSSQGELYLVLGVEDRPTPGTSTLLQRTLHRVQAGKGRELLALETRFDATHARLGTPPRRRYWPLAGTLEQNVEVVEREWESLEAALAWAENVFDPDAELQSLMRESRALIEESRTELHTVL